MIRAGRGVIVTCLGGTYAPDTVQALRLDREIGARIIGVDADRETLHRHLVDEFYEVPSASEDPDAFVQELARVAERTRAEAVLPCADEEVRAIAGAREQFAKMGLACPVEAQGILDLLRDKGTLFTTLRDMHVPLPAFRLVHSAGDMKKAAGELGYPRTKLMLKPRTGRGARGLAVVDPDVKGFAGQPGIRGHVVGDLETIIEWAGDSARGIHGMMLMEFLPGAAFDVDCLAQSGDVVCMVCRRRVWNDPFSPMSQGCRVEREPDVESLVAHIVRALRLNYVLDFDVAVSKDGRPGLMEINPRLSGAAAASVGAGVNFPALVARVALGRPLTPVQPAYGSTMFPVTRMVFLRPDGSLAEPSTPARHVLRSADD